MTLIKSSKVGWRDILNISFIYYPIGYVAGLDQFAEPCRRVWVNLVVESGHAEPPL